MARRSPARKNAAWVGDLPVSERTLANGLKAIVLPRPHAPVVVCDLYYPVGSVDEPPGKSGLSHFVEHMMFKGTERLPKGQIDRLAFVAAGHSNAETGEDETHYWFGFPSDRWEVALAIEADRMRGATFDPVEVEAERHVIADERARVLGTPLGRLDQHYTTVAFLRHPYRNPVIGWPEDLASITVDDLRDFHDLHYRPDGAVLVVVGDVKPRKALDAIESYLGPIPRGHRPRPDVRALEPRQTDRREFQIAESDSLARGLIGWHTVPSGHPDVPALEVLSDLLTCGRRSRLWDGVVETARAATWIDADQESAAREGQFVVQLEAPAGADPGKVEASIRSVLDTLAKEGPTEEELARSRHRLESAWRWEQEDLAGLANGLGQAALRGDWREFQAQHRASLDVGAEDIRRVVATYLGGSVLTAGWSLPTLARSVGVLMPADDAPAANVRAAAPPPADDWPIPLTIPTGGTRLTDYKPKRTVLPNGLRVVSEARPGAGVVALELYVDAGVIREAKPGVGFLAGRMLEEGTRRRSTEALAGAIEDIGGTLELGATGATVRVRSEDLPMAVDLLAEATRYPAFPFASLAWVKRRITAELEGDYDDPAFFADLLFRTLVYGDHPYGRDTRGTPRSLARLSITDVRAHHTRLFAPDNAILVAVGDFDTRKLRSLIRAGFGSWMPIGIPPTSASLPIDLPARVRQVDRPGEQVQVVLGHLGVPRNHPDFEALAVLDHILGSGPGFNDRLSRVVRDELGLAYAIGGGMTDSADRGPGVFRVSVGTGPDEVDQVVAAVMGQVRAMHEGAFSDEEVEGARQYLAGSWVFDYQTVEHRVDRLMEMERWGLGLDQPILWPERVARVTPREVRRAAMTHIRPEAVTRVELGPTRRPGRRASAECA